MDAGGARHGDPVAGGRRDVHVVHRAALAHSHRVLQIGESLKMTLDSIEYDLKIAQKSPKIQPKVNLIRIPVYLTYLLQ